MMTKRKFITAAALLSAMAPLISSLSLAETKKEEKEKPQLLLLGRHAGIHPATLS